MADNLNKGKRLKIANARAEDRGQGLVTITKSVMADLGLVQGDVIEIKGKRNTTARAILSYPEDDGLDIIRLDGLLRINAGVGSGDFVDVRKAKPRPAERIIFAPAQQNFQPCGSENALKRAFAGRPLATGDIVATTGPQQAGRADLTPPLQQLLAAPAFAFHEIRFTIVSTVPEGIVYSDENTVVELHAAGDEPLNRRCADEPLNRRCADVTYDDLGGMGEAIDQVRDMVELPLRYPELFARLGVDRFQGILLHGPVGTGKASLARAVATESAAEFFRINGPEIMASGYGEGEKKLRDIFETAAKAASAIVFIDEIDLIAPHRDNVSGEAEKRFTAQLLMLMDGIEPRANLVVIAATNRPEAIDETLRRPGRFDREIIIGAPDTGGRRHILGIHTRAMPLADGVDLDECARITFGFVGADLAALTRIAAIGAMHRIMPMLDLETTTIPAPIFDKLAVTREDFLAAIKCVEPSAMREVIVQRPGINWSDIGGLSDAQAKLREGIALPLKNPEAFRRLGIRPAKGFLLYGPPGTGKALLAKAVASEAQANFIATRSSDLLSRGHGEKGYEESEQQISRLFARARHMAPCIIFIDEMDSLVPARGNGASEPHVTERVVNTILAEMDGIEDLQSVVVIGATNRPNLIDPALLRPGRLDELIYVSLPDEAGRKQILILQTKNMPLARDVDLNDIAKRADRFTGADIEDLVRRAGLAALRESMKIKRVSMTHFETALANSQPSVTPEVEREYTQIGAKLKIEVFKANSIGFVTPGMLGPKATKA